MHTGLLCSSHLISRVTRELCHHAFSGMAYTHKESCRLACHKLGFHVVQTSVSNNTSLHYKSRFHIDVWSVAESGMQSGSLSKRSLRPNPRVCLSLRILRLLAITGSLSTLNMIARMLSKISSSNFLQVWESAIVHSQYCSFGQMHRGTQI